MRIVLPSDLSERLFKIANRREITTSQLVRELLSTYCDVANNTNHYEEVKDEADNLGDGPSVNQAEDPKDRDKS